MVSVEELACWLQKGAAHPTKSWEFIQLIKPLIDKIEEIQSFYPLNLFGINSNKLEVIVLAKDALYIIEKSENLLFKVNRLTDFKKIDDLDNDYIAPKCYDNLDFKKNIFEIKNTAFFKK